MMYTVALQLVHDNTTMQEYVNRGKHSFLPLTRLDHRQHDAEFEAAFDVEYTHKSAPVSILLTSLSHSHHTSLSILCSLVPRLSPGPSYFA